MSKEMHHLIVGNDEFEVVDEQVREHLDSVPWVNYEEGTEYVLPLNSINDEVTSTASAWSSAKIQNVVDEASDLTGRALIPMGALANGTDLNTITDFGVYSLSGNNTYTNTPDGMGFGALEVLRPYGNATGFTVQRLSNNAAVAVRFYANNSWYDWLIYKVNHKHSADDITSGVLPRSRGGTGVTTASALRDAIGLGSTTGPVPVASGGTGASSAAAARDNLGLGDVATESVLPLTKGGTGATTAADARINLGVKRLTVESGSVSSTMQSQSFSFQGSKGLYFLGGMIGTNVILTKDSHITNVTWERDTGYLTITKDDAASYGGQDIICYFINISG